MYYIVQKINNNLDDLMDICKKLKSYLYNLKKISNNIIINQLYVDISKYHKEYILFTNINKIFNQHNFYSKYKLTISYTYDIINQELLIIKNEILLNNKHDFMDKKNNYLFIVNELLILIYCLYNNFNKYLILNKN